MRTFTVIRHKGAVQIVYNEPKYPDFKEAGLLDRTLKGENRSRSGLVTVERVATELEIDELRLSGDVFDSGLVFIRNTYYNPFKCNGDYDG